MSLNICYEISKEGKLSFALLNLIKGVIEAGRELNEVIMPQIVTLKSNRLTKPFFDKNDSQKLSHGEILALRDSGKSVITELIQNSSTFEQRIPFKDQIYSKEAA